MTQRIIWLVLAAIHFVPAMSFFRPATLTSLYGVSPGDDAFLLMRHRAALFLVMLLACCWAAFAPETRRLVSVLAAISMLAFLALYFSTGSPGALRTIAIVDLAGLPFLAAAFWFAWKN